MRLCAFWCCLIIPIFTSSQVLSTIALSAVYWNNFEDWSVRDSLLFTFGLILIFTGIGAVSHGQKHQSMAHHKDDRRHYILGAKHSLDMGNESRDKTVNIPSFSGRIESLNSNDI